MYFDPLIKDRKKSEDYEYTSRDGRFGVRMPGSEAEVARLGSQFISNSVLCSYAHGDITILGVEDLSVSPPRVCAITVKDFVVQHVYADWFTLPEVEFWDFLVCEYCSVKYLYSDPYDLVTEILPFDELEDRDPSLYEYIKSYRDRTHTERQDDDYEDFDRYIQMTLDELIERDKGGD